LHICTFSIVARDRETGDLGVAVASKYFAVGAVVPWLAAGVGAVATQAWANTDLGPDALKLLEEGLSAGEALDRVLAGDDQPNRRQLGIVDADGGMANFTGEECLDWAGATEGDGYTVQGNLLADAKVIAAMAAAYEGSPPSRPFAERLMAALEAAQEAGGDVRGQQAAAMAVVRRGVGQSGFNDRIVDLRVDDHPAAVAELRRLLELHRHLEGA
jgi:uncharacterized Ntn-hydrolase superfamily protein